MLLVVIINVIELLLLLRVSLFYFLSDVDEVVHQSQSIGACDGVLKRKVTDEESGDGDQTVTKKQRIFKELQAEDKIYELSNKQFADQSKRKIRWAVKLFSDWRMSCMGEPDVADQILNCDLSLMRGVSKKDLAYALCRFIREVKNWMVMNILRTHCLL